MKYRAWSRASRRRWERDYEKLDRRPDLRERLATQGADVAALSGGAYGKLVMDEAARWKGIVQAVGIAPQ